MDQKHFSEESSDCIYNEIKSGNYFRVMRSWYHFQYLQLLTHRSIVLVIFIITLISMICVFYTTYISLPIYNQVRYSIKTANSEKKIIKIIPANYDSNDPLLSIGDILIKNYVNKREQYDYDLLKNQFEFLRNNSTRIVFNEFFKYINTENPNSPVLRFQNTSRKSVKIISTRYFPGNNAIVIFDTIVKNNIGETIEHLIVQATIDYEIEKINPKLPEGSRFNFTVTEYQTKILERIVG